MLKNYLITAIRMIWKNKLASIINILGLSLGFACSILIFLFVEFELSYDDFHEKKDRIYRITETYTHSTGIDRYGSTPHPLAPRLQLDFPDMKFSRVAHLGEMDVKYDEDQVIREQNILFVDTSFFDLFDYEWIIGSSGTSLTEPNTVVLTETLAKRYFPEENPLGKTIRLVDLIDCRISGIIHDSPANNHLPFNMILTISTLTEDLLGINFDRFNTSLTGFGTYVLLPRNYQPESFEEQAIKIIEDIYGDKRKDKIRYHLEPLSDIHFDTELANVDNSYTTDRRYIYIYVLVGLFILLIASINFINLSTAQVIKRSREVGIRKVIGAYRKQLIAQFISETFLIVCVALLVSIIIGELMTPKLNAFLGYGVTLSIYSSRGIFVFLLIVLIVITLLSGLYPSYIISKFKPVQAIQHSLSSFKMRKSRIFSLRSILVILQFVISLVLIIATFIIGSQMNYMKNKDLGFTSNGILVVEIPDADKNNLNLVRRSLSNNPGIINFSLAIDAPKGQNNLETSFFSDQAPVSQDFMTNLKPVDTSYLYTFNLELVAGSWLDVQAEEDTIFRFVVNERITTLLGFNDPHDALGKHLKVSRNHGIIQGVVENFHAYSLWSPMESVVFMYYPDYFHNALIKYHPEKLPEVISYLESEWAGFFPESVFEYNFLDKRINESYEAEMRTLVIIKGFALLAIVIACLGLFGLVSYLVVNKTREIGIRKVLGASIPDIIRLISKDFILLVIIAFIIAAPLAWLFADRWLGQFTYRVSIHWWIFVLTFFLSLFIAFLTISWQAMAAALTNPVEAVRGE